MHRDPGRVILYLDLLGNIILEDKGRDCIGEAIRRVVSSGILGNLGSFFLRLGPLTFVLSCIKCVTHFCHLKSKECNGQSLQLAL